MVKKKAQKNDREQEADSRAQEALRESEERYRSLAESSQDYIFIIDRDDRVEYVNRFSASAFGTRPEALIGKLRSDLFPPDISGSQESALRSVFETGDAFRGEAAARFGDFDGWLDTRLIPLRAKTGEVTAVMGIARDITERKQTADAIQRRAEELAALQATVLDITAAQDLPTLLRTIVERAARLLGATGGGLYLCDPDKQHLRCVVSYNTPHDYVGTILQYGEGAAGVVAQSEEPLVIDDYRCWSQRAAVYEEEQPFTAVLSVPMAWQGQVTGVIHVLDDVETRRFTQNDLELLALFANHAAIAVENARLHERALKETTERKRAAEELSRLNTELEDRVRERTAQLESANKELQGEITQRVQAEEELSEERNLLRTLIDNLPDFIFIRDTEGRFLISNAAQARSAGAKSQDEVVGKTDFDLFPRESAQEFYADDCRVLQTGEPIFEREEVGVDQSTGKSLWLSTTKVPLRNTRGEIVGVMGIARDITERKRAAEELTRLNTELEHRVRERTAQLEAAGKELQDSEAFLRLVIDTSPATVFLKNRNGEHLLANKAHGELHGIAPEEFAGKTDRDLAENCICTTEQADRWRIEDLEVIDSQQPQLIPRELLAHADGTVRWIQTIKVPLTLHDDPNHVLGISLDITERVRAEEALTHERDLLMALMDNMPDLIYFKDTDGRFIRVNKAIARLAGMDSPEELVGLTDFDYLPPGSAQEFREDERKIVDSGQPMVGKIEKIPQADGEVQWRRATKVPLKDEEGRVTGIAGISSDITELMQAEEALRESEERYRDLYENAPNAYFSVGVDGRISRCNSRAVELLGYAVEELVGRPVLDLYPNTPQGKEQAAKVLEQFRAGETVHDEELQMRKADGIPVWISLTVNVVRDAQDRVEESRSIVVDITDRKRAEEAVAEERSLLRTLVDTLPDHIYVKDKGGRFVLVNEALVRNMGFAGAHEVIGTTDFDVFPADKAEEFHDSEQAVLQGTGPMRFDENWAAGAGETRWFSSIKAPLRDVRGEVVGLVGMSRDVTERVRAEEKIQASLREKEVLLQEIHHRVKNNLAIISSLLAWQSETVEDKQTRAAFRESQNRIRSMARIHEQLYHSPDLARVAMAEYIQELAAYLGQSYGSHDVTLTTDAADVVLELDWALPCGLIINELVSNCLKHAFPAGRTGEIRVTMHPLPTDEGKVELTVSDNGAGLPDHLDIDNIKSLGLSVVRLLARQLDGTLELDRSEGTTFKIVFQVPDRTGAQEE